VEIFNHAVYGVAVGEDVGIGVSEGVDAEENVVAR